MVPVPPLAVPSPVGWPVLALAFVVAALAALPPAAGQCEYDVTVLPCLYVGDYPLCPTPTGMNNVGQIVGYIDAVGGESARGFVWSEKDGLVLLPNPPGDVICRPYDINDAGTIVGTMGGFWTPLQAFIWDGNQYLGLGIPPGGTYSQAFAINEDAVVVGRWGNQGTGNPASSAFVWQHGVMTDLGPRLGTAYSQANDINNTGQITGWMGHNQFDARAFRLAPDGTLLVLPPAPGAETSMGEAINEAGDICGTGRAVDPNEPMPYQRGFAWIQQIMRLVPRLPGLWHNRIKDIDEDGVVVGYTSEPAADRAFVWRDGAQALLRDLVIGEFFVFYAEQIDSSGRIAAVVSGNGVFYDAALLTPVRVPGDIDHDCDVDLMDILELLREFGCRESCAADADGDDDVDLEDLSLAISSLLT